MTADRLKERDRRVKLGLASVPPRIVADVLPSLIDEPLLNLSAERSHRTSGATVSPAPGAVNHDIARHAAQDDDG